MAQLLFFNQLQRFQISGVRKECPKIVLKGSFLEFLKPVR